MRLKSVLDEDLKLFLPHKVSYDLIFIIMVALSILWPVVEAPARHLVVQAILTFPAHLTEELYLVAKHALTMFSSDDLHSYFRSLLDLPL